MPTNSLKRARAGEMTVREAAEEVAKQEQRLKRMVPDRLPPASNGVPYTRQTVLVKGHTSFLTFSTLWVKDPSVDAVAVVAQLIKERQW